MGLVGPDERVSVGAALLESVRSLYQSALTELIQFPVMNFRLQ